MHMEAVGRIAALLPGQSWVRSFLPVVSDMMAGLCCGGRKDVGVGLAKQTGRGNLRMARMLNAC